MEKADSFQGACTAPEAGFTITAAPGLETREEAMADLAASARDRNTLPAPLLAAVNGQATPTQATWRPTDERFIGLDDDNVAVRYAVMLDVPKSVGPWAWPTVPGTLAILGDLLPVSAS